MRSRATIANHPLHPAFVVVPLGCWFATLVGDLAYANTADPFWYRFAYFTMLIGVLGALVAAVFGFIDYFGVRMSAAGRRLATMHMVMNLVAVVLYALNLWLRVNDGATTGGRWVLAFWLQIVTFAGVIVSGWIGGSVAHLHKVSVVENLDPEATSIGAAEPATPQPTPRARAPQP